MWDAARWSCGSHGPHKRPARGCQCELPSLVHDEKAKRKIKDKLRIHVKQTPLPGLLQLELTTGDLLKTKHCPEHLGGLWGIGMELAFQERAHGTQILRWAILNSNWGYSSMTCVKILTISKEKMECWFPSLKNSILSIFLATQMTAGRSEMSSGDSWHSNAGRILSLLNLTEDGRSEGNNGPHIKTRFDYGSKMHCMYVLHITSI